MTIKIFDKMWYVHRPSSDPSPLCYLTHLGDSNDETRQNTGKQWAGGYKHVDIIENTFDNNWTTGFHIDKSVQRYSTSNVVWRVIDPRGFMLEIYSGNMSELIRQCTITSGVISGECKWGREGGKNILIPKGSEDHKSASTNETRKSLRIKPSDVKVGDVVHLISDNRCVVYLGKFFSHSESYSDEVCFPDLRINQKSSRYTFARYEEGVVDFTHIFDTGTMDVYNKIDEVSLGTPEDIEKNLVVTKVETALNYTYPSMSPEHREKIENGDVGLYDIMLLPTSPKNLLKFGYELIPHKDGYNSYQTSSVKRIKQ